MNDKAKVDAVLAAMDFMRRHEAIYSEMQGMKKILTKEAGNAA